MTLEWHDDNLSLKNDVQLAKERAHEAAGNAKDARSNARWAPVFAVLAIYQSCSARTEVKDLQMLLASEKKVEDVYGGPGHEAYFVHPNGKCIYVMIDGMSIANYKSEYEDFDVEQLPCPAPITKYQRERKRPEFELPPYAAQ